MPYQYKREPLSSEQSDKLANAAESFQEKLVIFTLLDTGLRVSELSNLKKDNIQWQERRLMIYGKGGPYGKKTKRRVIPMTDRVRRVLEHHFAFENTFGISVRNYPVYCKADSQPRWDSQASYATRFAAHV